MIKRRIFMCKKLMVLMLLCLASVVWANVSVENPFSDNAVLQREKPVPIWGTADVGEQVTVDFNGQSKSTTADGNGDWMVYLDPMSASTAPSDLVITGNNVVTITGVQVGEVWLFSGQSNMWFQLNNAIGGAEAIADMPNHNIVSFRVGFNARDLNRVSWKYNESVASAVAYFTCHELSHALGNIPIGMIQAAKGGTDVVEWTHASSPSDGQLYEWKIVPMQPYAIRGMIWYQGENEGANMEKALNYEFNLNGLISEWRTDFQQGNFPVGVVQLHNSKGGAWAVVQNAHLLVSLADPDVGLAVNWDTSLAGAPGHPDDKYPVGYRLGLWARNQVYGESGLVYSGPIHNPALSSINGSEIVIGFNHVHGGLVSNDGAPLAHFTVAGSGRVYYPADAQIVGDTVVVSSPSVPSPEAVQHVWFSIDRPPTGALFNTDGLPAPVFEMALSGGSYCDDGTCDPGEDQCNCPEDCGSPPATETNCFDEIDEDCDTFTDCDDSDCDGDPACPSCGDTYCDIGEDQCNCPEDCGTPPATETNCTDGIDNDCGGGTDCDDADCDLDPACDCVPKNGACTDNADCCSGNCRPSGRCA
jgi:sialate O-acetylesterase